MVDNASWSGNAWIATIWAVLNRKDVDGLPSASSVREGPGFVCQSTCSVDNGQTGLSIAACWEV